MAFGSKYRNALPAGAELQEYRIESVLGQGGFGITYQAYDTNLDASVAIKEYLPQLWASRDGDAVRVNEPDGANFDWGLRRFLDEARVLARFRHPNIVQVLRYFRGNNTAYMVMHHERGQSLTAYLRSLKREPTEADLKGILMPLLDGLAVVHQAHFLHRDIKPANIIVRDDGTPVLLDFGAARQAASDQSSSMTRLVSRGYTPPEQATGQGAQGPWTDLFALASVMYRAITGEAPADASQRAMAPQLGAPDTLTPLVEIAAERYSRSFLAALDWAMTIPIQERPHSVPEWRAALDGTAVQSLLDERAGGDEDEVATALSEWDDAATVAANRNEDEAHFRRAEQTGTIEAFESYLVSRPDGRFEEEARAEVGRLRSQQSNDVAAAGAWERARKSDTAEAYRSFLNDFPDSDKAEAARAALVRLTGAETRDTDDDITDAAERQRWKRAREADTVQGYQAYLAFHPAGTRAAVANTAIERLEAEEARRRDEGTRWEEAKAADTAAAYEAYLEAYPDGRFVEEATARLDHFARIAEARQADLDDWATAQQANTQPAYEAYLTFHPEGEMASEARQAIKALGVASRRKAEEEAAWAAAVEADDLDGYASYLDKFPDGPHARDANARIDEIEAEEEDRLKASEQEDWRRAAEINTADSYRSYLAKHPHGEQASIARLAIKHMQDNVDRQRRAQDEDLWQRAIKIDTQVEYRLYLAEFPDGIHAAEAQAKLDAYEATAAAERLAADRAAWREADGRKTAEAYSDYLRHFPNGEHAEEAREAADRLRGEEYAKIANRWKLAGPLTMALLTGVAAMIQVMTFISGPEILGEGPQLLAVLLVAPFALCFGYLMVSREVPLRNAILSSAAATGIGLCLFLLSIIVR